MYTIAAGVRVDTWIETGTEVTPFYDSLLGKMMVFGADRAEAVKKLQAAIAANTISGIPTNLEYHAAIAASPKFAAGEFHFALTPKSSLALLNTISNIIGFWLLYTHFC